ncbi:hypothetical protein [Microvirga terrestris]|uniref:Uncharacterized protein n=1 Tax=Microvirga terrestris TaxID=2791024 RepID=A0ABS0HRK4_9HYPH|nr:hypothetical protein [Microvirga terrestris]MBF9196110.1 hypothetical protein [Microvirga terrestris]
MKEQYVGDINDYRKYALLRALAEGGVTRIGVCWMLTPPDGRPDGNKVSYLNQPQYERFDSALFALLKRVKDTPNTRRLVLIEESGIIPDATYVNTMVPDKLFERQIWFSEALKSLHRSDLIFFDPDNGLEVSSKRKGQLNSSKYLYRDEVAATYQAGHSILIYQHFPREERRAFIERISTDLHGLAPNSQVWVFQTSHVAFFLLIHPHHEQTLSSASLDIAANHHSQFLMGECPSVEPNTSRDAPLQRSLSPIETTALQDN